jgi:molecular chaperone GrpE (heat shock protein)
MSYTENRKKNQVQRLTQIETLTAQLLQIQHDYNLLVKEHERVIEKCNTLSNENLIYRTNFYDISRIIESNPK